MSHLVDIQPWLLMHPGNDVLAPEEMKAATKIMGKLLRGYIDFTGALIESYVDFAKEEITPEVVVAIGKLQLRGIYRLRLVSVSCLNMDYNFLCQHGVLTGPLTRRSGFLLVGAMPRHSTGWGFSMYWGRGAGNLTRKRPSGS